MNPLYVQFLEATVSAVKKQEKCALLWTSLADPMKDRSRKLSQLFPLSWPVLLLLLYPQLFKLLFKYLSYAGILRQEDHKSQFGLQILQGEWGNKHYFWNMCIWVFVCGWSMHECMSTWACMEVRGQHWILSFVTSSVFWGRVYLTKPRAHWLAKTAGCKPPGIFLSPSPSAGVIQVHTTIPSFLCRY